ncbi:MAG TPA: EthD family reductase [Gemmatimonadaceae bacterium]
MSNSPSSRSGSSRYEVSRPPIATPAGDEPPYLIAVLDFETVAAMRAAFATPEGRASAADRRILAPDDADLQMYLFESTPE